MKKILCSLLVGIMLISSLSVSASANFSDVKETDWYYTQVMAMTEKGLFKGKGNNLFCPNDIMTEAEFLTVIVRALYPDEDTTAKQGQEWWQGAYDIAVEKGIIEQGSYENSISFGIATKPSITTEQYNALELDMPITRQEMADLSVKALNASGETDLQPYTYIIDVKSADEKYRESVKLAYGAGILVGDNEGFFNPKKTLTRAEASTVLYRIIEKSARVKIDFDSYVPITIYEGQRRTNRNAQEGDTFVKSDGTKIVLKKGPNGILGEGQGVAPDASLVVVRTQEKKNGKWVDIRETLYDSTGNYLHIQEYRINRSTGEGHWSKEIQVLEEVYREPAYDGSYDGEISQDPYKLWMWISGMWVSNVK